MDTSPPTLTGRFVRLEPLSQNHHDGLVDVAADGPLWNTRVTSVPTPDLMFDWIERNAAKTAAGEQITFAILYESTGQVVGTSSFLYFEPMHRRLEIGKTWIATSWQRTPINTEAKMLLLQHAFEQMQCLRVQFLTDVLNRPSCAALERLGATREGVIRYARVMPDGRNRDSACYSVVDPEWPIMKVNLQRLVDRPFSPDLPPS